MSTVVRRPPDGVLTAVTPRRGLLGFLGRCGPRRLPLRVMDAALKVWHLRSTSAGQGQHLIEIPFGDVPHEFPVGEVAVQ
jgi:hypothetical protein